MKKSILLGFLFSVFVLSFNHAQEDGSNFDRFNLSLSTGIGYGQVKNENQPNYNLNANVGEALLTYHFNKNFGLSAGVGWLQLSGDGFNTNGNFYHERDLLKFPLMIRSNKYIADKFNLSISAGFYGQTIINEEFTYLTAVEEDVYGGWSFGFQGFFGFEYEVSDNWSVGINVSTQSDFTKLKTENDASFKNEQSIETLNTIGLLFGLRF